MNDIKTKESVVGNSIKVLDKSANLSDRMKDSYIRTKQSAEHSYYAEDDSPEEYASNKVTETSETIGYEAAYQFDEHGRKGFETTKGNIIKANIILLNPIHRNKRENMLLSKQKNAPKKFMNNVQRNLLEIPLEQENQRRLLQISQRTKLRQNQALQVPPK